MFQPRLPPVTSALPVHFMSDEEIMRSIGERVQRHRLSRNLTQQEVADHAGISRNSVRKVEAGQPVGLDVFVAVMRDLHLLEAFYQFVPAVEENPYKAMTNPAPPRKRARKK